MPAINVVFGCYEHCIFGFEIEAGAVVKKEEVDSDSEPEVPEDDEEPLHLKQLFSYASHIGSVRSVAAAGKMLVTGSADESINLYDLKRLKEVGQLHNHGGTITVVAFAGQNNTHMISGSADGVMCLWKCSDWTCLHTIHVHSGGVISLALHPSSRLALSVGHDNTLKIWNLLTGKLAHSLKLDHTPSQVLFNPSGNLFAIVFTDQKQIQLYNLEGKLTRTLEFPHKLSSATFLNDNIVAAVGEEGHIGVWDSEHGFKHAINLQGVTRIKTIVTLPNIDLKDLLSKELHDTLPYVIVATSEGLVIVLSVANGTILATHNTHARITCAAVTLVPTAGEHPNPTPTETQTENKKKKKNKNKNKKQDSAGEANDNKPKQNTKSVEEDEVEDEDEEVEEEEEQVEEKPQKNKKDTKPAPKSIIKNNNNNNNKTKDNKAKDTKPTPKPVIKNNNNNNNNKNNKNATKGEPKPKPTTPSKSPAQQGKKRKLEDNGASVNNKKKGK